MRQPNSGLPEFGNIIVQVGNSRLGWHHCPSRQQPTWMAQTRNLEIPGSRYARPGMTVKDYPLAQQAQARITRSAPPIRSTCASRR
jgi:hypothetical protein